MECFRGPKIYRPLQGSEIRLVSFKPSLLGSTDAPVEVELFHVPLDEFCMFYALSYVWGDPTNTVPIIVDEHEFPVTRNLYDAILNLRNWSYDQAFHVAGEEHVAQWEDGYGNWRWWVDAICINQADKVERSREVQRMHAIYSAAELVIIWLGLPGGDISEADLDEMVATAKRLDAIRCTVDWTTLFSGSTAKWIDVPARLIAPLAAVLGSPWFSRIWTVQEAVLAVGDPVILYGRHAMTFFQLWLLEKELAAEVEGEGGRLRYLTGSPEAIVIADLNMNDLLGLRTHCKLKENRSDTAAPVHGSGASVARLHEVADRLYHCVALAGDREATNPHDRIYGFLGLAGHSVVADLPPDLLPDYNRPFSAVCQSYTRMIVQYTGFTDILGASDHSPFDIEHTCPSWVSDFRSVPRPATEYRSKCEAHFSTDCRLLITQGVVMDRCLSSFRSDASAIRRVAEKDIDAFVSEFTAIYGRILEPATHFRDSGLAELFLELMGGSVKFLGPELSTLADLVSGMAFDDALRTWCLGPGFATTAAAAVLENVEYFVTEQGYFGEIFRRRLDSPTPTVHPRDLVCLLKGSIRPMIIRAVDQDKYRIVCRCNFYPLSNLSEESFDEAFYAERGIVSITFC